ncbi:MAG: uracil-DNA glycosylase [Mitsuaria chitosanitabida]|uniref:uracil-DNA glycosylase n=1 Tax=Roseateles chitosanitabidus TaxID=65048 RepID=UPI001B2A8229|nr:uracil-DNA glycosylase [Roseateles chitosanitabidus]MBO9687763.1 uracil-DNA glycosylase [Roseateles chitosanitabidus]
MGASFSSIDWQVGDGWQPLIDAWRAGADGQRIEALLKARVAEGAVIYPPDPLRALRLTPLTNAKVVIVGQDPYHGPGQAEGLAFSVPIGQKLPPSLRNIFKELLRDLGQQPAMSGHLVEWAKRGVLLLNTSLTVEDGAAASHAKKGWESLTDALIAATAQDPAPKVYLLWGAHAQAKAPLIESAGQGHLVLQSNHPSPLSATRGPVPFIGCGHFSTAREWLAGKGVALSWALD